MSNKKKFSEYVEALPEDAAPVVVTVEAPQAAPAPEVRITFDRWFAMSGRLARHKAGMLAYTSTTGKRTVAAWDAAFQAY
jgi:hypothetical protein